MLIHRETQKIVLNLSQPDRVTTVIPSAKKFLYEGQELVAIPHRLDEVRVLRNLGFNHAPSPAKYYYNYSGMYEPFRAQSETTEFLTMNPRAFVLNDMGTGKTLAALWAFDYLRQLGEVKKALVISPLSTLERTWADEVFRHFPHLTAAVLHGTKEKRLKLLAEDRDIYLINHDGIKTIYPELIAKGDIDLIVIDEIASFRNASTQRWKALNKIVAPRKWVWGMTGTPTPNEPTDAWAQCRLINPSRVPPYFGKFRDATMRQQGQFKWLARENATDIVYDAMQPSIRFTRDQCVDLPPAVYQTHHAPLTPEQTQAYKAMKAKMAMEFEGDQSVAVNEAVKLGKLVQIACGAVYGTDGQEIVLPCEPRIGVVSEIIENAGTKTIVFVPYKSVLHHVAEVLGKTYRVAELCGETPKAKRDEIFHQFQNNEQFGPQVLVAQPAAMSHGLTLTAANTVVWYAPVTSHEVFSQANARITRPGQKHTQFLVCIEGTEVERRIYDRLKGKEKMQGLLLDMVRG